MIQKLKKSNAGFTLVELIVVIAILGVLAAVLVPQYIQYVEKARVATDKNTVATIEQAINVLCADGTIKAAEVLTWTKSTGALTSTSTTGASIAALQAVLNSGTVTNAGAVNAATVVKIGTSSAAVNVTFTVTFTGNIPHEVASPAYTAW